MQIFLMPLAGALLGRALRIHTGALLGQPPGLLRFLLGARLLPLRFLRALLGDAGVLAFLRLQPALLARGLERSELALGQHPPLVALVVSSARDALRQR